LNVGCAAGQEMLREMNLEDLWEMLSAGILIKSETNRTIEENARKEQET
jgi:hypothetical protein